MMVSYLRERRLGQIRAADCWWTLAGERKFQVKALRHDSLARMP